MTKTKRYRLADALRVKAELDEMPEREPEAISLREALTLLSPDIHALRRKNYSWEDIVALFEKHGVQVSISVLKKRVGEHRDAKLAKGAAKAAAPRRRLATTTASTLARPTSLTTKGDDVEPDSAAEEGATSGGTTTTTSLKPATRPGNDPVTRPAGPPPLRAMRMVGESTPGTPATPGDDVPKTARQPSVGGVQRAAEDVSGDAPSAGVGTVQPQVVIAMAPTQVPKGDGARGAGRPKGSP